MGVVRKYMDCGVVGKRSVELVWFLKQVANKLIVLYYVIVCMHTTLGRLL